MISFLGSDIISLGFQLYEFHFVITDLKVTETLNSIWAMDGFHRRNGIFPKKPPINNENFHTS